MRRGGRSPASRAYRALRRWRLGSDAPLLLCMHAHANTREQAFTQVQMHPHTPSRPCTTIMYIVISPTFIAALSSFHLYHRLALLCAIPLLTFLVFLPTHLQYLHTHTHTTLWRALDITMVCVCTSTTIYCKRGGERGRNEKGVSVCRGEGASTSLSPGPSTCMYLDPALAAPVVERGAGRQGVRASPTLFDPDRL